MSKHIIEILLKEQLNLLNDLEDRKNRLMHLRNKMKDIEFDIGFDEMMEAEIKTKINDMNKLINTFDKELVLEIDDKIRKKMRDKMGESKWNSIPVLRTVEDINKMKINKKERKIYMEAIKRASKIVDSDPEYYGEHAHIVLNTVIIEMGYNPKDIKGY